MNIRSIFFGLLLLLTLPLNVGRAAETNSLPFVSPMFGDKMVLQRGKPIRFLGLGQTR